MAILIPSFVQVVSKLSRELVYAKMELDHVTKDGGDVMAIRKRVVWLEDRMEALLSRYRPDENEPVVSLSRVNHIERA